MTNGRISLSFRVLVVAQPRERLICNLTLDFLCLKSPLTQCVVLWRCDWRWWVENSCGRVNLVILPYLDITWLHDLSPSPCDGLRGCSKDRREKKNNEHQSRPAGCRDNRPTFFLDLFPWFLPGCTVAQITQTTERPDVCPWFGSLEQLACVLEC